MSERDNFDKQFDEMMGVYEDQLRDPTVTAVLASVAEAEAALKQARGKATSEQIDEVMFMLNSESEKAELVGHMVVVSGKLRATELIDDDVSDEDDDDEREEKQRILLELADELDGIGGVKYDERGSYFEVSRRQIFCGTFDLNKVKASPEDPESEETEDKVIVYFAPTEESDVSIGWAYAYPSDLEVFLPEMPSALKINKEITEQYPAIAMQLDTLPADCRDPETMVKALQGLVLEINWDDYPRLDTEDRKELIEYIEQYMTNRVNFDTTLHLLSLHDYFMAMDVNGNRAYVPLSGNEIRNGLIGHIRLLPLLSSEDDTSEGKNTTHYHMSIELFSPVSEHGGGNNLLQVPVSSIDAIGNTRNPLLQIAQTFAEYANPFSDLPPVPVEEAGWSGFSEADEENEEDAERDEAEVVPQQHSSERPSVDEREKELIAIERRIKEIFSSISNIVNTVYDTLEAARTAYEKAGNLAAQFSQAYKDGGFPLIEANGTGVLSLRPKIDFENSRLEPDEEGAVTIRLTDVTVQESDVVTERRGYFNNKAELMVGTHDELEGKFAVEATLEFTDADANKMPPIAFGGPVLDTTFYKYTPSANFVVRIDDHNTVLTIAELERLRRCRETIATISEKFPDLQYLPWQLTELHELVDSADPNSFEVLNDMDLIHTIGESVGGDEKAAEYTADALKHILHEHLIEVTGEMYDSNGAPVESRVVRGFVKNVTTAYVNVPTEEPMLVMSDKHHSTWLVPIASLESFSY